MPRNRPGRTVSRHTPSSWMFVPRDGSATPSPAQFADPVVARRGRRAPLRHAPQRRGHRRWRRGPPALPPRPRSSTRPPRATRARPPSRPRGTRRPPRSSGWAVAPGRPGEVECACAAVHHHPAMPGGAGGSVSEGEVEQRVEPRGRLVVCDSPWPDRHLGLDQFLAGGRQGLVGGRVALDPPALVEVGDHAHPAVPAARARGRCRRCGRS